MNHRQWPSMLLRPERLEPRYCLTAVTFVESILESASGPIRHDLRKSGFAVLADLDGDKDPDVVFANDSEIVWRANIDGEGQFGDPQSITTDKNGHLAVYSADLDNDGDVDILSARVCHCNGDVPITWYENADGTGSFRERIVTTHHADLIHSVLPRDIDGDGDLDILVGGVFREIAWYENTDGAGTFGPRRVAVDPVGNGTSMHASDVDGDGDVDVLTSDRDGGLNAIAWYENTDGSGTFGNRQMIADRVGNSLHIADVDGDGDVDVLSMTDYASRVAWYENIDGVGKFGERRVISLDMDSPIAVLAADIDGDNDLDVLVLVTDGLEDQIAWLENTDGKGSFGELQVFVSSTGRKRIQAADVDGDGDVDVLSASRYDDRIVWYENRLVGDANDDRRFDSADLVCVFETGEYEDGVAGNSSFDEGDWNLDGDFDSSDLVLAFQAGHYESAVRPLAAEIAVAVDWLFAQNDEVKTSQAFVA